MKRIVSSVLVCVMLLSCVLALASCGVVLSGKYENSVTAFGVTTTTSYEFEGKEVTVKRSIGSLSTEYTGEYEVKTNDNDEKVIVFTFGEEGNEFGGEYAFAQGNEDGKAYIKIGNTTYTKAD